MTFQKFSKWLLTKSGKQFLYYTAGTVTTGIMLAHVVPNTFLLNNYQRIIEYYNKGMSVPVSRELQDRFQKTLDLLEVPDQELYKPFHVYGFDIMSAGHCKSKFGVIIGLPINFRFDSVETASEKPRVQVGGKDLDWNSEQGTKLLSSLVLSKNAQMYAMACEMKMRQTWKLAFDVIFATTSAGLVYGVSNHLNTRANLYNKPRSVRLVMYALVTTFFTTTYFMLKDALTNYLEKKIDEDLINKNPLFLEGGRDFYAKIIERNKSLREILGKSGEKLYTALGNENTYLRTKHTPLVQRKSFFDEKLSESSGLSENLT